MCRPAVRFLPAIPFPLALPTYIGQAIATLSLSLALPTLLATPAYSAERIYVSYGVLERSISIQSLEIYAREGRIEPDLAAYAEYADPKQLAQFREVLLTRIPLGSVALSQFFYTRIGENLLTRLGQVIQSESRGSGFYAIRAALILAADDRANGLTLLNVLKKFPTPGIRIDVGRSLEIAGLLEQLVNQTNQAFSAIAQQAAQEASTELVVDFNQLPDLREQGPFGWNQQTLTLDDRQRRRTFPMDLYLPVARRFQAAPQAPYPLIVISHGLGSDRSTFAYLARHLTSYGFAVAVPEHAGSNAQQLQALIEGRANEVADPAEFINRPLDVTFLLNELSRRAETDPALRGQLNLQQVGILGQSFGGYTALAVAGANINFSKLRQDCPPSTNSLNLSLLLQCLATQLPEPNGTLRDPRIKAAIAINPVSSSVLGQTGIQQIQIPTMLVTASADTAAPALPEQILPFTWLTTPNKYLVSLAGGTHFSVLGPSNSNAEPVPIPDALVGPNPAIARRYMNALTVAFFQTYIANRPNYRVYLSAAYANNLSQAPLPLNLVRSLSPTQLAQAATP